MTNPMQVSLQEEFNRLNFLASIATGDGADNLVNKTELTTQTTLNTTTSSEQQPAVVNGIHSETSSLPDSNQSNVTSANAKSVINSTGALGKINSLLINPGQSQASILASFQIKGTTALGRIPGSQAPNQTTTVRPKLSQTPSSINDSQTPRIPLTVQYSPQNVTPTRVLPQVKSITPKKAISNLNISSAPTKLIQQQTLTEGQKRLLLSGVNILQSNNTQGTNTLMISQTSQPGQPKTILTQPTTSSASGQTIILPANLAGIQGVSGKVYIVSTPGKVSQAMTLNTTAGNVSIQQLQQQAQIKSQNDVTDGNKKHVVLLPNMKGVEQTPGGLRVNTSPQKHKVVSNTSAQSLKIQQSPQLLQRIQHTQPIAMSNFQTIRPKSTVTTNTRLIHPKGTVTNTTRAIINSNQAIKLTQLSGHEQTLSSFQFGTTSSITRPMIVTTSSKISSVVSASTTSAVLMSQFDKTMSQHLQTLEKTDPHLFLQSASKLIINQTKVPSTSAAVVSSVNTTPQNIQEKVKVVLQKQQQQQQAKNITTPVNLKQVTKTQINLTGQRNATTISSASVTPVVSKQSLTVPQKQQLNLQHILKQQLAQQQQQQQQQNIRTTGKLQVIQQNHAQQQSNIRQLTAQAQLQQQIALQQQKQLQQQQIQQNKQAQLTAQQTQQLRNQAQQVAEQLKIQQQQQQQLALNQAQGVTQSNTQQRLTQDILNKSQMYLQQKLLQQVQSQQRLNPQLVNVPLMQQKNLTQQNETNIVAQQQQQQQQQQQIQAAQQNILQQRQVLQQATSQQQQQQQQVQPNQPLKLLSNLANLMQHSGTSIAVSNTPPVLQAANSQRPQLRPVQLVQLPNGAQMLQTTQLTPAQMIELQKQFNAGNAMPVAKSLQPLVTPQIRQIQPQIPNIVSSLRKNSPQNFTQMSNAAKMAIRGLGNRASSPRSAFSNKNKGPRQQTIVQRVGGLAPSLKDSLATSLSTNPKIQEQIKHLSPAQKDLLMKQYASGKLLKQTNVNPLLSSILKQKQGLTSTPNTTTTKSTAQVTASLKKKEPPKTILRGTKRPAEEEPKKEPPEHPFAKRWRSVLQTDQMRYVSTSYRLPFTTDRDAYKRLLPYHIIQDTTTPNDFKQSDFLFEAFATNFHSRKERMIQRFNLLLLKESQKEIPSCDDIYTGRLYMAAEMERFQTQKKAILEGRAFVVKNEKTDQLDCVEVSLKEENNTTRPNMENPQEQQKIEYKIERQLDNRLVVAHKDMSTIDSQNENDDDDDDDDEEEYEEDEEEVEDLEVEEISDTFHMEEPTDNEMADAATNLLADLEGDENEDYHLDFGL